jgi:hypothetical protein
METENSIGNKCKIAFEQGCKGFDLKTEQIKAGSILKRLDILGLGKLEISPEISMGSFTGFFRRIDKDQYQLSLSDNSCAALPILTVEEKKISVHTRIEYENAVEIAEYCSLELIMRQDD